MRARVRAPFNQPVHPCRTLSWLPCSSGSPKRWSASRRPAKRTRASMRRKASSGTPMAPASRPCPGSTGWSFRCSRASTGCAISCSTTRGASPAACRLTTPCSGAHAAWARARSSRRCTAWWRRTRQAASSSSRYTARRFPLCRSCSGACAAARTSACSSATTSPSNPRTPPTSRSRRRWRAASAAGPTTSSSTPPRTGAT